MDYAQTLEFLFERLPMFSRLGPKAYKADLVNITALCEALDNPQNKFRSIHVAGTNGKGSVSHMLAAVLQKAGLKTGLHTSPHLHDFRERFRIGGEMIPEEYVVSFTGKMQPVIDLLNPSFFELTVAMGFAWFAENKVDIAVIETGLGGRLDSTNILVPILSVITNISLDHTDLLGNTLELIAFEKAGIIKPGVPVVVGEEASPTAEVFREVAANRKSPLHFASARRYVDDWKYTSHGLEAELTDRHSNEKKHLLLDLPGLYQTHNLVTVAEAIAVLNDQGFHLSDSTVKEALRSVKKSTGLHGRWETVHENPTLVMDVGHNQAGIREIVRQLEFSSHERLHIVIGMVSDKDIVPVLRLLPKEAEYYFTQAAIPRALDSAQLAFAAEAEGLKGKSFQTVREAVQGAIDRAGKKDLILVCGSIFVVAEVPVKELSF